MEFEISRPSALLFMCCHFRLRRHQVYKPVLMNFSQAINALANLNFSTAIFAPGWTFEHFRGGTDRSDHAQGAPQAGRLVEQTMWEGAKLSEDLQCDCTKGMQQHKLDFQNHPIVRHAQEFPAGSGTYFETDFKRAFSVGRQSEQAVCTPFSLPLCHPFGTPEQSSQIPERSSHATQTLM